MNQNLYLNGRWQSNCKTAPDVSIPEGDTKECQSSGLFCCKKEHKDLLWVKRE